MRLQDLATNSPKLKIVVYFHERVLDITNYLFLFLVNNNLNVYCSY